MVCAIVQESSLSLLSLNAAIAARVKSRHEFE
jgi:hypothetical protein